jgi:hypothetical protein
VLVFFLDNLHAELPLGIGASLDRIVQVATVEVRVLARELECLVPDERVGAKVRGPVVFDECGFAFLVE